MTQGYQLPDKWQSQLSSDTQMSKWRKQLSNDTQMGTTGPRWKGRHRLHRQIRVSSQKQSRSHSKSDSDTNGRHDKPQTHCALTEKSTNTVH